MGHDATTRLDQLQARLSQLGELAAQLAAAIPEHAEGHDKTGYVYVVLDNGGLPNTIDIRNGWHRRLQAVDLGAAVMDANADAVRHGVTAWTDQLDDARWWARRAHFEEYGSRSAIVEAPPMPPGAAREPAELTEDVLTALKAVQQPQPAAEKAGAGWDPGRRARLTLNSAGLASCSLDSDWAARQDGSVITAAVAQALRAAKAAMPHQPTVGLNLDGLVGDALATLRALTDQRGREGRDL
jgi:hypothetical protein